MSAETLRKASALMRSRADRIVAPEGDDITASWADEYGPRGVMNGLERVEAEHIASWHPAVALAVADLLEQEAAMCDEFLIDESETPATLAVATTYLGADA